MAIIASYPSSNYNADATLGSDVDPGGIAGGYGVCFVGNGYKITDSQFFIRVVNGAPTGPIVCKIWTMTGTFGVDGNVGSLLATSDSIDASAISGGYSMVAFTFSGAEQYVTSNGSNYVVTIEYTDGDNSNSLFVGYDSSGTYPGTWVFHALSTGGAWTPIDAGIDFIFQVDGQPADVVVNLTGVAASPQIGTGTVVITAPVPTVDPSRGIPSSLHYRRSQFEAREQMALIEQQNDEDAEVVAVILSIL